MSAKPAKSTPNLSVYTPSPKLIAIAESRDSGTENRLEKYNQGTECFWGFTSRYYCNSVCPMEVALMDKIGKIKQEILDRKDDQASRYIQNLKSTHRLGQIPSVSNQHKIGNCGKCSTLFNSKKGVARMFKKRIKLVVTKIYDIFFSQIGNFAIDRYMETRFLFKYLLYGNEDRLQIAETAVINNATFNTISGDIKIGEYVFFGLNVSVLTGTHDYNKFGRERQITVPGVGRDVIIKEGAWLASNVTVIGPCIIGEHSVVAAGSLVNKDVQPYTIVAGIPARVVKKIDPSSHSDRTFSE